MLYIYMEGKNKHIFRNIFIIFKTTVYFIIIYMYLFIYL